MEGADRHVEPSTAALLGGILGMRCNRCNDWRIGVIHQTAQGPICGLCYLVAGCSMLASDQHPATSINP